MENNENKRKKFDHRDPFAVRDWELELDYAKYGSVTEDLKDLFSRRKQFCMLCFKKCPSHRADSVELKPGKDSSVAHDNARQDTEVKPLVDVINSDDDEPTCERPFQPYLDPDVILDKPTAQYSGGDTKIAADHSVGNKKSVKDDISKEMTAGLESSKEYDIYTNQATQGDDIHTSNFSTDNVFRSRQDLIDWVKNVGRSLGYIIVIKRSMTKPSGVMSKVILMCDRGGKYKGNGNSIRNTGTKKINCPFALAGKYSSMYDCWTLRVICEEHNHEPAQHMEGHPYAMRLTEKEVRLVEDLSKKNVKPRDILSTLKEQNPENVSTLKTIYNACQKIWAAEHEGRTRISRRS